MKTSYISKINELKDMGYEPVLITRYKPKDINVLTFDKLAPSSDLLWKFKKNGCEATFTKEFKAYLNGLNKKEIIDELVSLSEKELVLVCYETGSAFCHRHIVADWLSEELGEIEELRLLVSHKGASPLKFD